MHCSEVFKYVKKKRMPGILPKHVHPIQGKVAILLSLDSELLQLGSKSSQVNFIV